MPSRGSAGSMPFVYVHVVAFALWMLVFERSPWPTLTLIVSLEAIFLSTFVMIGQNRSAAFQQTKADHDFVTQESELTLNTELTQAIHTMTQEIHAVVLEPGRNGTGDTGRHGVSGSASSARTASASPSIRTPGASGPCRRHRSRRVSPPAPSRCPPGHRRPQVRAGRVRCSRPRHAARRPAPEPRAAQPHLARQEHREDLVDPVHEQLGFDRRRDGDRSLLGVPGVHRGLVA